MSPMKTKPKSKSRRQRPVFYESDISRVLEDEGPEYMFIDDLDDISEYGDEETDLDLEIEELPAFPADMEIDTATLKGILAEYYSGEPNDEEEGGSRETKETKNKNKKPTLREGGGSMDLHEFVHTQEHHQLERKIVLKLPTHMFPDKLREEIKAVLLEYLKDEACVSIGDSETYSERINRLEKSAFANKYLAREYVIQVSMSTALLSLQLPFLDSELMLGCVTPEMLHRVDLAAIVDPQAYFATRRQLLSVAQDICAGLLEVLLNHFEMDVDDWRGYEEKDEAWKCRLESTRIRPEPVQLDVCIVCMTPQHVFKSIHKNPTHPNRYDKIGFCSIKCFTEIGWPSKQLTNNLNRIKYN